MSTCKQDIVARDRDVWLSVPDDTETETFPHFAETETFEKYVSRPRRRDRDYNSDTYHTQYQFCIFFTYLLCSHVCVNMSQSALPAQVL